VWAKSALSCDTSVSVEIRARIGAEDVKNVVDGVARHAGRLEFHWIPVSEEVCPGRVQPQILVDLRLFLCFCVRILAQPVVTTLLFLYTQPTPLSKSVYLSVSLCDKKKTSGCTYELKIKAVFEVGGGYGINPPPEMLTNFFNKYLREL